MVGPVNNYAANRKHDQINITLCSLSVICTDIWVYNQCIDGDGNGVKVHSIAKKTKKLLTISCDHTVSLLVFQE
jgi:hypothetical protein